MENSDSFQYVDPEVTRIKFEKELQLFKHNEEVYRKRGIICYKIENFSFYILFAAPHIKPHPIAFAVKIDYTNWDVEPPSIKPIDPFTDTFLPREEVLINFLQKGEQSNGLFNVIDLLQGNKDVMPFFCFPGVKEYHNHAAHSGDSWMLHRNKGEGELSVIIEQLYKHSIAIAAGYGVNVSITGINADLNKLN